jgi:hypothetical protein
VIDQSRLLQHDAPVLQHDKVRNTHDVIALRESGPAFGVDFQDDSLPRHIRRDFLNLWSRHSAGTAPGGPEIDQYRNRSFANYVLERFFVGIDWFRDRVEFGFARAAVPHVGQVLRGYAVLFPTSRTVSNHGFSLTYQFSCGASDVNRLLNSERSSEWLINDRFGFYPNNQRK